MNRRKWSERSRMPFSLSPHEWFAKLGEEFGEVGKELAELTEARMQFNDKNARRAENRMIEELSHVEFIARCMRVNIEKSIEARRNNG